jgi:hypothetical protein
MTDNTLRVPGYQNGVGGYLESDDEDEFDIIEMTPREGPGLSTRDSFDSNDEPSQPPPALSSKRPPAHAASLRTVAPLRLHTVDSGETSEITTPERHDTPNDLDQRLVRDPSGNSDASVLQAAAPGLFGYGFLSGIAKALGGAEDQSPISVRDGLMRKRRSGGQGANGAAVGLATVPPMRTALRDSEDASRREEMLFENARDGEAVEFARYMKEDGGGVARTPVLCMCDYGDGSAHFAADLWVLPHNALRRELFDLYEIMGVVRSRYLGLRWGDIYNLRCWWRLFSYFWRQYLVIEAELLDPLITSVLDVDGRCDQIRSKCSPLSDDREWISLKLEEVDAYMEEFETLPLSRVLGLICQATDALGFKMLSYFNGQERLLPALVENYHDQSIKLSTELQMLNIIRDTEFAEESIVHLVRWMDVGKERDKWLTTHLWWSERSSLRRMYKRYNECHSGIVDSFGRKVRRR